MRGLTFAPDRTPRWEASDLAHQRRHRPGIVDRPDRYKNHHDPRPANDSANPAKGEALSRIVVTPRLHHVSWKRKRPIDLVVMPTDVVKRRGSPLLRRLGR